jgi:integrase
MRTARVVPSVQDDFDRQPSNASELSRAERDKLVVSIARVDGRWIVLSRFGDEVWQLLPTTSNTRLGRSKIDFSRIAPPLRETWKECFYRYMRKGLRKRAVSTTIRDRFQVSVAFAEFLHRMNISRLGQVTQFVTSAYIQWRREYVQPGSRPIGKSALVSCLTGVETLYEVSQYTSDPMPTHPWPDTSASHIAGMTGQSSNGRRGGRTPLIPDDVFAKLFQAAWGRVQAAQRLLDLRDALQEIENRDGGRLSISRINQIQNAYLEAEGVGGGCSTIRSDIRLLRTSCYIVLASLSGCRNHELSFLENGACYSTRDDEGNTYWWMRSQSTKTDEGRTEWMIPEAAARAIAVMERFAIPLQDIVKTEIMERRRANPSDIEIAEALRHQNALFLANSAIKTRVRTLSLHGWKKALADFCAVHEISWELASHQFRRAFANYAARSQFGDLRYLKEHFKHWSMDMTLGYALNANQEVALYLDILQELDVIKEGVAQIWLDPREPLSGGYGTSVVAWRGSDAVTIFKSHEHMVRSIAASTAIRSTGHAWCTADDNLCIGNDLERTRCSTCSNAAIGRAHGHIYQGMYDQLLEVAQCSDIGISGQTRVQRDLERCRIVLSELGYAVKGTSQ